MSDALAIDTADCHYRLNEAGYMQHRTNPYRYQHRDVWAAHFGPIPFGYHVHHDNEKRADNRIDNLFCIEGKEHLRMHGMSPGMMGHLNRVRRGWPVRQYDCVACDKRCETKHPTARFCGRTCTRKYHNWLHGLSKAASRAEQRGEQPCAHCGTVFLQAYSCQKYCRPRCQAIVKARRQSANDGHAPTPSMYRAS